MAAAVVRRLATGELIPLARATGPSGVLASASSSTPDLDADGSCGVFATRSTNLVPAVVSADVQNVWMRVLGPGCPDPDPGAAPPPGAGPARDTTRPVLSRVSMRRARFRAGPRPTALVARKRAKRGSAFRFTSSEAGTLRIAVARKAAGRRAAGRCRKPTPKLRGRKRCTRLVAVGTLRRSVAAGRGTVAFSGRLRSGSLRPRGTGRACTVTDAAGNRSAARRVAFRVVRWSAAQQAAHGRLLRGVVDREPGAAVGQGHVAGGLEHGLVPAAAGDRGERRPRAASARPCRSARPWAPPTRPRAGGRTSRTT